MFIHSYHISGFSVFGRLLSARNNTPSTDATKTDTAASRAASNVEQAMHRQVMMLEISLQHH
jgi:hypothetical protein